MLIKKPGDIKPSEITDREVYRDRRRFIRRAGLLAGGVVLAAAPPLYLLSSSRPGVSNPKPGTGASREVVFKGLPAGPAGTAEPASDYFDATSYNNFYELGYGKREPARNAHLLRTRPWSVTVEGECDRPGVYDLEDILRPHALEERIYRLRCVEAWSMVIPWVGFSLGQALQRFEPNSRARFVQFTTLYDPEQMPGQKRSVIDWPYSEGLRMDEALNPLATLAVGMYGEVLPGQNGAPLRLVLPWKYGFKSIKSIVGIRFTETQPKTSWNRLQPGEYGFYANVNPAVDHPRWSQKRERRIGDLGKRDTLAFNGYGEQVAHLYQGMDLEKYF